MEKEVLVLQEVVFAEDKNETEKLHYDLTGKAKLLEGFLQLEKEAIFSSLTYMNAFDAWAWNKYTGHNKWQLAVSIKGIAHIRLYQGIEKKLLSQTYVDAHNEETITIEFSHIEPFNDDEDSLVFFEIEALENTTVYAAKYQVEADSNNTNSVHLSVLICTYKRNRQVCKSLKKIEKSKFFQKGSTYYKALSLRIIDNGSELPLIDREGVKLYHNPNTGGSGGFTRGIVETRIDEEKFGITHVVFMDDDAEFEIESFYRLYALLRLIKPCYKKDVIAGRMFDLNNRCVQYTASEVWNKGDIIHIGFRQDLRKIENLSHMNKKLGQYSGWWFACYPMSFVRKETPLPFFIHCDDVEYGLRHGGLPIILNGIQVWHDTFEGRLSPLISYYDTRNAMIVNTLYNQYKGPGELLKRWWLRMVYDYKSNKKSALYPSIVAIRDYAKGQEYFMNNIEKKEGLKVSPYGWITLIIGTIQLPFFYIRVKAAFKSYKKG